MNVQVTMSAQDVIRLLELQPHPEGGHFRETFRDLKADAAGRACSTLIYFLLAAGERSAWHRVDATEIWHYYAGAPLQLEVSADGGALETILLGPDLLAGQRPQGVVPAHGWQAAASLGAWTLVGCTVAPGFEFSAFELAPPQWRPSESK
jgi:predicted cupin superfamily sugar epimerase